MKKNTNGFNPDAMERISQESGIEISYNGQYDYLYCNWIGNQTPESMAKAAKLILQTLELKKCKKILNDNTFLSRSRDKTHGILVNYFPQFQKAGLQQIAWIVSPNIFIELSTKKLIPASGLVTFFHTSQEAELWLKSENSLPARRQKLSKPYPSFI